MCSHRAGLGLLLGYGEVLPQSNISACRSLNPCSQERQTPCKYGIIAFGAVITLANDGDFDKDEKLYGNNIRIKRGKKRRRLR